MKRRKRGASHQQAIKGTDLAHFGVAVTHGNVQAILLRVIQGVRIRVGLEQNLGNVGIALRTEKGVGGKKKKLASNEKPSPRPYLLAGHVQRRAPVLAAVAHESLALAPFKRCARRVDQQLHNSRVPRLMICG